MFEIIVYIFAIWGVVQMASALIGLLIKCSTPAFIIYPMDKDNGDVYCSLKTLSRLNLPMIVIKADDDNTKSLENEFLYADFVSRSDIDDALKTRI